MSKKDPNARQLKPTEPKEPTASEEPSTNEEARPASEGSRKQSQKSGQGLSFLSLLVAVMALGLSGYIGWRVMPVEQSQLALITGQEIQQAQIARLQARLTEVHRELTPVKAGLNQQEERSERLLSRMDSLARHLQEVTGTHREGWKLAEVEYLLRLANQRLLMSSDTRSAKALLGSADQLLLELDNYNFYPVREALAEDIVSLNSLQDFDQEGLYLKFEALTHQMDQLPLMERAALKVPSINAPETSDVSPTGASSWQAVALSMLDKAWKRFVSLFRFTPDRDQKITSLLSPEEHILIRQNLQLMLEQAKLSVLSRDQAIYNRSLQQASSWIEKYFFLSGSRATAILGELEALGKVTVKPEITNISRALDLLKTRQVTDGLEGGAASPEKTEPVASTQPQSESPQPLNESPQPLNESLQPLNESLQPLNESLQPLNKSPQPLDNNLQQQNNTLPLNRNLQAPQENNAQLPEAPADSLEEPQE